MQFDRALLDLDYLVFSSHKTATQTIVRTLRMNGYACTHCHTGRNHTVNLAPGRFGAFAERYHARHATKLNVITVFREPIERHISSFFQCHGSDVLRQRGCPDIARTLIATASTAALQHRFRREMARGTVAGRAESLDELCVELGLTHADLAYDVIDQYGRVETEHCILHLLRFDVLIGAERLASLLSRVTEKTLVQYDENVSGSKWYAERQSDFTKSLRLPRRTIIACYETRAGLVELFHPGEYDVLLSRALARYGERETGLIRIAGECRRWCRSTMHAWRSRG